MELIKEILFYSALISGAIMLICLLFCGVYRCFCLLLDHWKNAKILRECLKIYIERKRIPVKMAEKDSVKFNSN